MNEAKEALRNMEQKYKLFAQQQFTFIRALEHTRENAHDTIRPVASISQAAASRHKTQVDAKARVKAKLMLG